MTEVHPPPSTLVIAETQRQTGKDIVDSPGDNNNGYRWKMQSEDGRYATFVDWPLEYMDKRQLAKSGFYYTKREDVVKCAYCGVELGRWAVGDDAKADHRKWSPGCPFVRGVQQMPQEQPGPGRPSASDGHDTCGKYGIQLRPNSCPENEELVKYTIPSRGVAYPSYSLLDQRLKSYEGWPVSIRQKPKELAEAGFFYTGKGDQTICFSCALGLKNWEEDDVPWEQHAKWFPKCSFLLLQKSKDFVESVQAKQQDVPNAPSTSNTKKDETNNTSTNEVKESKVVEEETKEKSDASKAILCKICWENEVGVVFLPCGHMVACINCAPALTTCAVCRCELEATVRAFLS